MRARPRVNFNVPIPKVLETHIDHAHKTFNDSSFELKDTVTIGDANAIAKGRIMEIVKTDLERFNAISLEVVYETVYDKAVVGLGRLQDQAKPVEKTVWHTSSGNAENNQNKKNFKYIILRPGQIKSVVNQCLAEIMSKHELHQGRGSGWSLKQVQKIYVKSTLYKPTRGASYTKTPPVLAYNKSCVNVQNKDDLCFLYAILVVTHPAERDAERPSKYVKFLNEFNITGLEFPLSLDDIPKFEKMNPQYSIMVYMLDERNGQIGVVYVSCRNYGIEVNLILLTAVDEERELPIYHYITVVNLSRLFAKFTKYEGAKHICRYCIKNFASDETLKSHSDACNGISVPGQICTAPKPGTIIYFKNFKNLMMAPLLITYDIESINVKTLKKVGNSTTLLSTQKPISIAAVAAWSSNASGKQRYKTSEIFFGDDCIIRFLFWCLEQISEMNKLIELGRDSHRTMKISKEQEKRHEDANNCWCCNVEFTVSDRKVRHHCHITNEYVAAVCNNCNINYLRLVSGKVKVPIVAHNAKNYDSHLIIETLSTSGYSFGEISCIAENTEKFKSFSVGLQMQFLDSYQLLPESLDALGGNLVDEEMHATRLFAIQCSERFGIDVDLAFKLLRKKGVLPYSYMDSIERFDETCLPAKEHFYNDLDQSHISDEKYDNAILIWNSFNCKTLRDYHDIYLMKDINILVDALSNARQLSLRIYGLDMIHYISTPSFAFDAMLRLTGEILVAIDLDMTEFIERGIRGGISTVCSKRLATANNKYCRIYDPDSPNTWIIYLDKNNLYGHAMIQLLPHGNFRWVDMEVQEVLDFLKKEYPAVAGVVSLGCMLEVDLDYPDELHDTHNDLPLAPEILETSLADYGTYQYDTATEIGKDLRAKSTKLTPNLSSKKNYVVHHRALKFYLDHGLILTKVHKVLEFTEKAWLRPYIELNTMHRKNSKNEFEKAFYKLMNNAVFGKTMENVRNRMDLRLVNVDNTAKLIKLFASPNFISRRVLGGTDGSIIAVHMLKEKVVLNKPIYTGQAILDLSKISMYEFWYDVVQPRYGPKAKLVYMDTDSFIIEIETPDIVQDFGEMKQHFDFSDYPPDHPLYDTSHKKALGYMKDECNGKQIEEVVALSSKMYSYVKSPFEYGMELNPVLEDGLYVNDDSCFSEAHIKKLSIRKAKGVKRSITASELRHEQYYQCVTSGSTVTTEQTNLRSKNHSIGIYKTSKISLSPVDTKRYILENGVDTLAFGHYKAREMDDKITADFIEYAQENWA